MWLLTRETRWMSMNKHIFIMSPGKNMKTGVFLRMGQESQLHSWLRWVLQRLLQISCLQAWGSHLVLLYSTTGRCQTQIQFILVLPWSLTHPHSPCCFSFCSFSLCFSSSSHIMVYHNILFYAVQFPLWNFIHLPTSLAFFVFETSGYNYAIHTL